MKKTFAVLMALLMVMSVFLASCTFNNKADKETDKKTNDKNVGDNNSGDDNDIKNDGTSSTDTDINTSTDTDTDTSTDVTHSHVYNLQVTTEKFIKSHASCGKKAVYYYSCECGDYGADTFEYGEVGQHVFDRQVAAEKYVVSEATATEKAVYYYSCVCGDTGSETFEGEYAELVGFTFTEQEGGYVLSKYTGIDEAVKIPKEYHGKAVIAIGDEAFKSCTSIKSVEIPEGVKSIGEYAFYYCSALESITIPSSLNQICSGAFSGCTAFKSVYIFDLSAWFGISFSDYSLQRAEMLYLNGAPLTDLVIPEDVTSIGNYQFSYYKGLKSVTLHEKVTSIGQHAFNGCTSLESVSLSEGILYISESSFEGCSSLKSVVIPSTVATIYTDAFYGCSSLEEITIPSSVTTIKNFAFGKCEALKKVNITDVDAWFKISFEHYDGNPLYNGAALYVNGSPVTELVVPSDITTVPQYAFSGCTGITKVTIPEGVRTIGAYAFYKCTDIQEVTVPKTVATINKYAFEYCTAIEKIYITDLSAWCKIKLYNYASPARYAKELYLNDSLVTELVIPNDVTSIGSAYTFGSLGKITSVKIHASVTTIAADAFDLPELESITVDEGNASFCSEGGVLYNKAKTEMLQVPKCINGEVVIPSGVKKIAEKAFYGCTGLTGVTIPDTVQSIGEQAFAGCTGLTKIIIPSSVVYMNSETFKDCTGLTVYLRRLEKGSSWPSDWVGSDDCTLVWSYKGD